MTQEKNKNVGLILGVVGAVVLFAGLFVYSQKNKEGLGTGNLNHNHYQGSSDSEQLNNLVGKSVPSFSLTDISGNVYSPENLKGKNVVLFFNEGMMCYPACWNQIAAFGKDERLNKDDVVVLSVIVDSKEDWQKAINQMPELSQAKVVFDKGANVSQKFGVLNLPSSMHRGSLPGHTYLIFDKEGVVRYAFDDETMAIRNDQILAEISKL